MRSASEDIKSMTLPQLQELLEGMGEKKFRAKQLYEWMHVKLAASYDEMTNLPKNLREKLKEEWPLTTLRQELVQTSRMDGTQKYLFALPDGNYVESVFMRYHHGNSVCISSQVGCNMGCRFCASTIGGKTRNLLPSEMLDQIYRIQQIVGERISNIVVMGTGEPLDNYENLVTFIRMISDENGLQISQRNITVSTCGIVPFMRQLMSLTLSITLALSLHATTQEKRQELMPIARTYPLDEVMKACEDYFKATGRRITFEYALVKGVNDTPEDAEQMAKLLGHMNCHVNLIPVNPIKERDFVRPDRKEAEAFQNMLKRLGVNATIRRELGQDIDGACGQLRKRHEAGE